MEEITVKILGEVRTGGSYLVQTTQRLTEQQGWRIRESLERTFPGSTFAVVANGLDVVEDWRTELAEAIRRAGNKLQRQFLTARDDSTRQISYAGTVVLNALKLELLAAPERADVLPESGPVEQAEASAHGDGAGADHSTAGPAPSSPDPMCGAHHPSLQIRCALPLGHEHSGPKRHAGEAQDCEVRWS